MLSIYLHGLDSRANYTLIVRAANSLGLGNPSMITLNTKQQINDIKNNRPDGEENGKQIFSSSSDETNRKQRLGKQF